MEFLLKSLEPDYITRLTLSGGDPLFPENRYEITKIIFAVRSAYPSKDIWLYTGYSWDDIKNIPFIRDKQIDVVVDGEFRIQMKDLNLPYRGSANQRLIDVSNRGNTLVSRFQ